MGPSRTMNNTNNKTSKKAQKRKKQNNNQQQIQQQQRQEIQQQEVHEINDDDNAEQEDVCNFCGFQDIAFLENEENLDLHYWQSCPMLTSCKLCEQVIEIATLHEHILNECESGIKHKLCTKCNVPYPINDENEHVCSNTNPGIKCPLCLNNISSKPDAWKLHLLKYPGCKNNPRPLLQ